MKKVLIADDDKNIAKLIADNLNDEGILTKIVFDGEEVVQEIEALEYYDLILLDIMMPKMDGLAVVKKIREIIQCPIIFVTAKTRTVDTLLGLEMGADDYITKPFIVDELVAKVKAHMRRDERNKNTDAAILEKYGEFSISRDCYELVKNQTRINLTTREFQLFLYLYDNRGKVLSREQIFDAVWGTDFSDIGSVNVAIKALRDKIDPDNHYIKTVWGIGYKLIKGDTYER